MKCLKIMVIVVLAAGLAGTAGGQAKRNKGPGIPEKDLDKYESLVFEGMPYRFLPPVNPDPAEKYPLILSLHGRAGVGNDNKSNMRNWTAVFIDEKWRKKYPCFVAAPQSMSAWSVKDEKIPDLSEEIVGTYLEPWQAYFKRRKSRGRETYVGSLSKAFELVEKLAADYNIDKDRVYVLGHSMGGFGSWNAICQNPKMFAAAIPSAGGLPPWKDKKSFVDVPVWAFHGSIDPIVPTAFTREIFRDMKKLAGNMKYTELDGVKHNASMFAFTYKGDDETKGFITRYAGRKCDKTEDVWDWLFKQTR